MNRTKHPDSNHFSPSLSHNPINSYIKSILFLLPTDLSSQPRSLNGRNKRPKRTFFERSSALRLGRHLRTNRQSQQTEKEEPKRNETHTKFSAEPALNHSICPSLNECATGISYIKKKNQKKSAPFNPLREKITHINTAIPMLNNKH